MRTKRLTFINVRSSSFCLGLAFERGYVCFFSMIPNLGTGLFTHYGVREVETDYLPLSICNVTCYVTLESMAVLSPLCD